MKFKLIMYLFSFLFSNVIFSGYGGHSMVAPLKKVLMRVPDVSFGNADPEIWHYTSRPDLIKAQQEHQRIVEILQAEGVQVLFHNQYLPNHADAIFVHDPLIITNFGAIVLRMGKALRQGEEAALAQTINELSIPILCTLTEPATAEGGDMVWLDAKTLVIGRGFRTNQAGIDQIKAALQPYDINVVSVDLPYDQGQQACLHLQSLISMIDDNFAVVYLKYLPVAFFEMLQDRGIQYLAVSEKEYLSMAPNILAIKPRVVVMLQDNVQTIEQLRNHGVTVYTYQGFEISHKAEGGATCLTRPILRN